MFSFKSKLIFVLILTLSFIVPAQATTTDASLPYLITDVQVSAPGFVKPVSQFDTYPHKLTIETLARVSGSSVATSTSFQFTQPNLDACIWAMKRIIASANDFGNIGSQNTNTTRKAYCTPAMQGAE